MTQGNKSKVFSIELEQSILTIGRAIVIAVIALLLTYFVPRIYYGIPVTLDASAWGAVGDFFGGVLNPFFSILTIYLLVKSLRLQNQELNDATEELKQTRTIHTHSLLYESTTKVFERRAETISVLPDLPEYALSEFCPPTGNSKSTTIASNYEKIQGLVLNEKSRMILVHLFTRFDLELKDFAQAGLDLLEMGVPPYVIRDTLNRVHSKINIINTNATYLKHEKHIAKSYSMYSELFEKAGITYLI